MSEKNKSQHKPAFRRLTEKQERFCQFYLDTDGNASEAYRMAYDASEMKPNSVWNAASLLLDNPKVAQRISEIRAERASESKADRDKVQSVLMDIVTSDLSDIYVVDSKTGKMKMRSPSQLPKRARNSIRHLRNNRGVVDYDFHSKIEAARLLGSWNGWDAPKEVNVNNSGNMMGEIRIGFGDDEE